jgi:hypothetical protein
MNKKTYSNNNWLIASLKKYNKISKVFLTSIKNFRKIARINRIIIIIKFIEINNYITATMKKN